MGSNPWANLTHHTLESGWVEKILFFQKQVELNPTHLTHRLNGFESVEGGFTRNLPTTTQYVFLQFLFFYYNYLLLLKIYVHNLIFLNTSMLINNIWIVKIFNLYLNNIYVMYVDTLIFNFCLYNNILRIRWTLWFHCYKK